MAGSTSKRVVAVRFDRESLPGFVDPAGYLKTDGIEILSPAGAVTVAPYGDVKALCFVRDFESFPGWRENRVFVARPKSEGIWTRFHFRDGDQIDGVLPSNLLTWEQQGFTISPPDPNFLNQRVFIPRAALKETTVMGVVGKQRRTRPKPDDGQLSIFDK